MDKHTPGPWRYEADQAGSNYMKIWCHNSEHWGDNLRGYCGEANARLIAAAPEMLAALRTYVGTLDMYSKLSEAKNVTKLADAYKEQADYGRAIIVKATGATP